MESPWHSEGAKITFGAIAAACGVAIIVLVLLDVRYRRARVSEAVATLGGLLAVGAFIVGAAYVQGFIEARLAPYPAQVRQTVMLRISILGFAFWFLLSSITLLAGAFGMIASFAILGPLANRESLLWAAPFSKAYWSLVRRSQELPRLTRIRLWARHEVFSVAMFVAGGVLFFRAFGLPWDVAWAAFPFVFAWIIRPNGLDKRLARELDRRRPSPGRDGDVILNPSSRSF